MKDVRANEAFDSTYFRDAKPDVAHIRLKSFSNFQLFLFQTGKPSESTIPLPKSPRRPPNPEMPNLRLPDDPEKSILVILWFLFTVRKNNPSGRLRTAALILQFLVGSARTVQSTVFATWVRLHVKVACYAAKLGYSGGVEGKSKLNLSVKHGHVSNISGKGSKVDIET